jgi:hypothetical protein
MVSPRTVTITVAGILALSSLMKDVFPAPYLMIKRADAALQTMFEEMHPHRASCVADAVSDDCQDE